MAYPVANSGRCRRTYSASATLTSSAFRKTNVPGVKSMPGILSGPAVCVTLNCARRDRGEETSEPRPWRWFNAESW